MYRPTVYYFTNNIECIQYSRLPMFCNLHTLCAVLVNMYFDPTVCIVLLVMLLVANTIDLISIQLK
jgi:hypothetical protein